MLKRIYFKTYIFQYLYPRWAKHDPVHLRYLFFQPEFTVEGSSIKQQHFPHKRPRKIAQWLVRAGKQDSSRHFYCPSWDITQVSLPLFLTHRHLINRKQAAKIPTPWCHMLKDLFRLMQTGVINLWHSEGHCSYSTYTILRSSFKSLGYFTERE